MKCSFCQRTKEFLHPKELLIRSYRNQSGNVGRVISCTSCHGAINETAQEIRKRVNNGENANDVLNILLGPIEEPA